MAYFNGVNNGGRVGDFVIIHQSQRTGAGNWELNKITGISGSTINLAYPLQNNYTTGAQVVSSAQWDNITLSGTTTPYLSWNGSAGGIIFLVCKNTFTINGTISVAGGNGNIATSGTVTGGSGGGFRGGNGGLGNGQKYSGEGTTGASVAQYTANGSGGGGAYISTSRAGGGGGGNSSSGSAGTYGTIGYAGQGGSSSGNSSLTLMTFGGGGGGGGKDATGVYVGSGASGGGIVFLIAKNISISGSITVNGGTGGQGTTTSPFGAGGGSGAGGSVLIKAQTATLGTAKITAIGGPTTSGGSSGDAQGGAGSTGRIHLDYAISYSGSTNPTLDVRQDKSLLLNQGNFLAFM